MGKHLQSVSLQSFELLQAKRHQLVECASAAVIGTPTFLQIQNCQELDRITGYSDAELFWLGHRRMMNRIESDQ